MEKWYNIYPRLAILISKFYEDNKKDASRLLYDKFKKQNEIFKSSQWYLETLKVVRDPGIDPIHIFSSFNQAKQKQEQRKIIINNLFRIFGSKEKYNDIDFTGCPCPFSLKLMSFRDLEIRNEIWQTFEKIIKFKQGGLTEDIFKSIKKWYGVDVVSLTIFLFWIEPKYFISVDKNNQILLYEAGIVKKFPRNYHDYVKLLIQSNTYLYIDISKNSYLFSHQKKIPSKYIQYLRRVFKIKKISIGGLFDFKIVAIQPLKGISKKHCKILKSGVVYSFYSDYNFLINGKIKFDQTEVLNLYGTENIDINISAIVGKNGSGKSTISEMIFLAINNIACKILGTKSDLKHEPGVNLSFFYQTSNFFKITLNGRRISVTEYYYKNGFYIPNRAKTSLADIELAEMFYTIAINYSHYSLNSNELGEWISNLFHKNDGYQTPLVINPFREKGNFDINRENELAKARLLSNSLQKFDPKDRNNLRLITDNNRFLKTAEFYFHLGKLEELNEEHFDNSDIIFKEFIHYFSLENIKIPAKFQEIIIKYLASKLNKVCKTYQPYKNFLSQKTGKINLKLLPRLYNKIETDGSHITFKIKQVKNFIKYRLYEKIKLRERISLDKLSIIIEECISLESKKQLVKAIEFIPPSFLDFDLFLNDNSNLNKLSSGEKQRIYTVSSIVYHLNNIDSVTEENNYITYPLVNIIFDEIELYFHPDMQRKFISYLLEYIKRSDLDNIVALNLCFITHSPFILSDIPNKNILFLDTDGLPNRNLNEFRTFGGNIHDLLGNSFFLNDEGYMGEFANNKITSIIHLLENTISPDTDANSIINKSFEKESILQLIDIIGEPLIRESLRELFLLKYKPTKIAEIDREIERLQKEKSELI